MEKNTILDFIASHEDQIHPFVKKIIRSMNFKLETLNRSYIIEPLKTLSFLPNDIVLKKIKNEDGDEKTIIMIQSFIFTFYGLNPLPITFKILFEMDNLYYTQLMNDTLAVQNSVNRCINLHVYYDLYESDILSFEHYYYNIRLDFNLFEQIPDSLPDNKYHETDLSKKLQQVFTEWIFERIRTENIDKTNDDEQSFEIENLKSEINKKTKEFLDDLKQSKTYNNTKTTLKNLLKDLYDKL